MAEARPLELIPAYDNPDEKVSISWRSDVWSSPEYNKDTPVRIYDNQFYQPFLKTETLSPIFIAEMEGFSSGKADLVVGKGRVLIGSDLRLEHAGIGLTGDLSGARWFSFSASFQSDSDQPFEQKRSTWIELLGTYVFARTGDVQWVALVNYSKNRGYLNDQTIPLIGIIYDIGPDLTMTVGVPFLKVAYQGALWKSVFAATPTGVRAESSRTLSPLVKIMGHIGYATRSYLHEKRIEDDMRLFFEEKYVDVGFKTKIAEKKSIEFIFGGSVNRNFYEGKQVYEVSGSRTKLEDDLYARIQFEVQL